MPEIFRRAIAEHPFHIKPDEHILRIVEEDVSSTCKWVEISIKNQSSTFCFTIDLKDIFEGSIRKDSVFPFFNANPQSSIERLRSKNDAILICQIEQQVYIFLIELKSKNKDKYLHQIRSSKIFVNFIIDRLNLLDNASQISKEDITFKGILFCNNKGTTRKRKKAEFDENKDKLLPIAEASCHVTYPLEYFLP